VFSSIWDFLKDGSNQTVLSWIGGGIVVVAGGLWAASKFLFPKEKDKSAPPPAVHADHGGFAAGRDIRTNLDAPMSHGPAATWPESIRLFLGVS
jgi:hypothetical protein